MSKRKSFEEVKSDFERKGYLLLDDKYINNKTPMRYLCSKHPKDVMTIRYSDLKIYGCPHCGNERKIKKLRYNFNEVNLAFQERGYRLLDTVYIDSKTPMNYICPKHPNKELKIAFSYLLQGQGCVFCGIEKNAERFKGEKNPAWKGGIANLSEYLRQTLYDWKQYSLEAFDFKCFVTGEQGKLEIHHVKPFHEIRDKVISDLGFPIYESIGDYSTEQLELMVKEINHAHKNLLGVPLLKNIHKYFHKIYGYQTTIENLNEFKLRYLSGEFKGFA